MAFIPIASQTLTSTATNVTFSSIPTTLQGFTLRDLVVVGANLNTVSSGSSLRIRFNSTTTGYFEVYMQGNGTTASSSTAGGSGFTPYQPGFGPSSNAKFIMNIMDFAQSDKHKSGLYRSNGSGATDAGAVRWANTSAISSIQLDVPNHNWAVGTTWSLYGVVA